MARRSLVLLVLISLFTFASTAVASADPGDSSLDRGAADSSVLALVTDDDVFSVMDLSVALASPTSVGGGNGIQHYGPYASGSPDSGTCGNNWAEDTFDRHFTVRATATGYTVVEQFKRGAFVTNDGVSPGSCDVTDGTPPGTIRAGVTGKMHGYLVITVTGTQLSTNPACQPAPGCTTSGFIASHFTGGSTVGTYFFHYSAGDQGLVEHEWKTRAIAVATTATSPTPSSPSPSFL